MTRAEFNKLERQIADKFRAALILVEDLAFAHREDADWTPPETAGLRFRRAPRARFGWEATVSEEIEAELVAASRKAGLFLAARTSSWKEV